jgi:hypothetical protein
MNTKIGTETGLDVNLGRRPSQGTAESVASRTFRPVTVWAGIGVVCAVVAVYTITSWLLSGDVKATPTGETPVPTYMVVAVRIMEVGGVLILPVFIYFVIIRPWRREGHLTLDGTILLALIATYWLDPMPNYVSPVVSYNSVAVNFGSWGPHIPGWLSANGAKFPEGVLWVATWYSYALFGGIVLINKLMRWAKQRWPRIGVVGLVLVAMGTLALVDLVMEVAFVRVGLYVFGSTIKSLTLFSGHYYQFPIYETVCTGVCWGAMASVRFFKDDRGRTFVERGSDRFHVTPKQENAMRFFAIFGLYNVMFVLVCLPLMYSGLRSQPWPNDILERSYLTNGICGPGSEYACPGGPYPPPLQGRAGVSPENQLSVPEGIKLPPPVVRPPAPSR